MRLAQDEIISDFIEATIKNVFHLDIEAKLNEFVDNILKEIGLPTVGDIIMMFPDVVGPLMEEVKQPVRDAMAKVKSMLGCFATPLGDNLFSSTAEGKNTPSGYEIAQGTGSTNVTLDCTKASTTGSSTIPRPVYLPFVLAASRKTDKCAFVRCSGAAWCVG